MQRGLSCGEKRSLTKLLRQTRAVYAKAVGELKECPSDQFGQAYELADNARFLFEITRDALNEHLEDHGC